MSDVELKDDIKVTVSNCGLITLVSSENKVCNIYVHPVDLAHLVRFLVSAGYNFSVLNNIKG